MFLPRMNVNAIIIGAQKSGTTALHKYLSLHPDIEVGHKKEVHFFSSDTAFNKGFDHYQKHFPVAWPWRRKKIVLDATPNYISAGYYTAERIFGYDSNIRLIALLRNPVDRAFSAWNMYKKFNRRDPKWFESWMSDCYVEGFKRQFHPRRNDFGADFTADMIDEIDAYDQGRILQMPIITRGLYAAQLQHYYKFFPREQLMIIDSDELMTNTRFTLGQIESFLDIKTHNWKDEDIGKFFVGKYEHDVPEKARALLNDFYHDSQKDLQRLLGRSLSWFQDANTS